jgi:hypothetical protein
MLPGQVGITGEDYSGITVFVVPDGGGDFASVGGVNDKSSNRIGPVIEAECINGRHNKSG